MVITERPDRDRVKQWAKLLVHLTPQGRDVATGRQAGAYLYFFDALLTLRAFLPDFAAFAAGPAIAKSSSFLPLLMAALNHRGLRPRPAQVSAGFSGLRYLGATAPLAPPRPDLVAFPPRLSNCASFASSVSSSRRRSLTFALMAASMLLFRSCSLAIGIVLSAMVVSPLSRRTRSRLAFGDKQSSGDPRRT